MIARRLAIIVPVLTTLVFGSWQVLLGPLLAKIAGDFGVPQQVAGWLLSINFAGTLVSVVVGGYLADRFGKKRVFLVSLSSFTAAIFCFAMAHSFTTIALACLLAGAVGGCLEGLCGAVIADYDPEHSDSNLNRLQMAFSGGAVLALVLASRMTALGIHWQSVYVVLSCVVGVVFLLALFMRVPPAPPGETISPRIALTILTHPLMVLLSIAIALYVGAEMGLAQWIKDILTRGGSADATAILAPALFWGMTGVGRFISGQLCRRFTGLRVLSWLIIGGMAACMVLLLPGGTTLLWIGTALAGLTFSGIWPLLVSLANGHFPSYSGTTVALMVLASNVGGIIFPVATGYILNDKTVAGLPGTPSWWCLLYFALLFLGLGIVSALYARARRRVQTMKPAPV